MPDTNDLTDPDVDLIQIEDTQSSVLSKLFGDEIAQSNLQLLHSELHGAFESAQAIEPPLDPLMLARLMTRSPYLRPDIDAIAGGIHGYGHRFEPVIPLDAADVRETVRTAIIIEGEVEAEDKALEDNKEEAEITVKEPTEQEIDNRIKALKRQSRREYAKLKAFFENCSQEFSFVRLCRKMTVDLESTGYCVAEVRRDGRGRPARIKYGQSWTFRALPTSPPINVTVRQRLTDISYRNVQDMKAFRKFVQIYEGQKIYFKEFGDPRVMSATTGLYYEDEKALFKAEEKQGRVATELLWLALDSPESDMYGSVRWSGCIPGLIGARDQAEVNMAFWSSKAIPPMVIFVRGGTLAKTARDELEKLIKTEVKGTKNFHKVAILHVKPAPAPGLDADKVDIEMKPLTQAIFDKPIWASYGEDVRHQVGQSLRIPPLFRGDTKDFNRATAQIAERIVEQNVFQPGRTDFEWAINQQILPHLGISLWRYRLNGPAQHQPEQIVAFVNKLVEGTLTVNEARAQVGQMVFGTDLAPIDADWARMPLKFALGGFEPEPDPKAAGQTSTHQTHQRARGEKELEQIEAFEEKEEEEKSAPSQQRTKKISYCPQQKAMTIEVDPEIMAKIVETNH